MPTCQNSKGSHEDLPSNNAQLLLSLVRLEDVTRACKLHQGSVQVSAHLVILWSPLSLKATLAGMHRHFSCGRHMLLTASRLSFPCQPATSSSPGRWLFPGHSAALLHFFPAFVISCHTGSNHLLSIQVLGSRILSSIPSLCIHLFSSEREREEQSRCALTTS